MGPSSRGCLLSPGASFCAAGQADACSRRLPARCGSSQERALRGTLAPHEASGIAAQIAAGQSAAHRQGVVHRDIKAANVMLILDRTVKIADSGIARFADEEVSALTATWKILGTADYLAPERALGRPAQTASDVYSLGCVLYELLTGRPPSAAAPFQRADTSADRRTGSRLAEHSRANAGPRAVARYRFPARCDRTDRQAHRCLRALFPGAAQGDIEGPSGWSGCRLVRGGRRTGSVFEL
ncbi:protein kinase [Streptomyces sp. NPDC056159]|uniref:protein kinase domain-containing protein n=1 Tax=Streptomyces sp. NPDC056159 TaxID=3155537 RepID=UPI003421CBE8